ncbi:uncharacterized protein LOC106175708 [Lingula anatina]|uniref:Uncharacterized protein LOC106175708 n=1 Tax=Lingula anatina TaxID=7574 RepID=A0A1S3JT51_LINAN|nr:uncharacterized protein LOC106175708 [Lingula anatina]|eukprot:XP_013413286.1 uncharacterized protein LOC106175708 [Lingula anatina]
MAQAEYLNYKKALETRHSNLQVKYEAACLELQKTQGLLEKLRTENKKKTEHIEGLQKEVTFMADRVKVLDQKALDLERAEITVEQLKRTLESYQKQNRDKESELKETRQCLEDTGKKLSVAHTQIEDLEEKASDLKQQVREELRRNEKLEQDIEGIPHLKEKIEEAEAAAVNFQKELREKEFLLQQARKSSREYGEKAKALEKEVSEMNKIQEELHVARCETLSLKQLIVGKDSLVIQLTQALEFAKNMLQELHGTGCQISPKIQELLDKASLLQLATYPQGTPVLKTLQDASESIRSPSPSVEPWAQTVQWDGTLSANRRTNSAPSSGKQNSRVQLDVRRPPFSASSSDTTTRQASAKLNQKQNGLFLKRLLVDTESTDGKMSNTLPAHPVRPKTAVVKPTIHSNFHSNNSTLFTNNGRKGSVDFADNWTSSSNSTSTASSSEGYNPRKPSLSPSHCKSKAVPPTKQELKMEREAIKAAFARMSVYEKDSLVSKFVNTGDRVLVRLGAAKKLKSKGTAPKEILHSGIVKFIGHVDREYADQKLYAGIRLDEAVGDTDGLFKGKRYFYVPANHGKLVRLLNVVSVLNTKMSSYKKVEDSVYEYMEQNKGSLHLDLYHYPSVPVRPPSPHTSSNDSANHGT